MASGSSPTNFVAVTLPLAGSRTMIELGDVLDTADDDAYSRAPIGSHTSLLMVPPMSVCDTVPTGTAVLKVDAPVPPKRWTAPPAATKARPSLPQRTRRDGEP